MKPNHAFSSRFRYIGLLLCCLTVIETLHAQTPEDSIALTGAAWETVETDNGLTIKSVYLRLFDSDQQIYCVEFNPQLHRLQFKQGEKRETVKRLGKKEANAEVAVNGGFFITKTKQAIANDFTKIDGVILTPGSGWGNGAIALDSAGRLHFIKNLPGVAAADSLWHTPYPNVMGAGPMLMYDNVQLIPLNYGDTKRHPRTVIGIRPDGTIILMVVDGRQEGADGMSPAELAWSCRMLDMSSALNLDGGGSSALWSRKHRIINRPSDKVAFIRIPRKVGNAVLVVPANNETN